MKELAIREQLTGIDDSKAAQIEATFAPMVELLKGFEGAYDTVMAMDQSEEKCSTAKRLRLDIAKIRVSAKKAHDEQKSDYLLAGRAIDGVFNIFKLAVTDKEDNLKEVETFFARQEAERIQAIRETRTGELEEFGVDASSLDLGRMADDAYLILREGYKKSYNWAKEAEQKAEELREKQAADLKLHILRREQIAKYARFGSLSRDNLQELDSSEFSTLVEDYEAQELSEKQEQERVQKENARLKAAEETAQKEREAIESKARKAKAAADAKLQRERKAAAETLRIEREAREAAEQKELQRLEDERNAALKAAQAPDKEKLLAIAKTVLSVSDNVESIDAKVAVKSAYAILAKAAAEL